MNIAFNLSPIGYRTILPAGYTRLDFLESTGDQSMDLNFKLTSAHSITCAYTPLSFTWINAYYGVNENDVNFYASYDYNAGWGRRCYAFIGDKAVGGQQSKVNTQLGQTYTSYLSATRFKVDGVIDQKIDGVTDFTTGRTCALFKLEASNGAWWTCGAIRIHTFRAEKNGVAVCELMPALDQKGEPCMYDKILRKPFYNTKSGTFIAGVGTMGQLTALLYRLPATGGALTLSLPAEANTPEVAEQLQQCHDTKGWTITVHEYRAAEVATYSLRRVREVVWCRMAESEHGPYADTSGTRWQVERCAAIFGEHGDNPAEYGYAPYDSVEQAAEEWGLVPYVDPDELTEIEV